MSKIKNGGLDQDGAERIERQQFGTAGVEGVKISLSVRPIAVNSVVLLILPACSLQI